MQPWQHLGHVLATLTDLVNTGPEVGGREDLPDLSAVRALIAERTITEIADPTEADLVALHALRRKLRSIVVAPDHERMKMVNDLLARATIEPRLVDHDGLGVHLHYFPPYAPLSEHLAADCAMALAQLLVLGDSARLRVCARPGCGRAMLDTTRNRSRTYCDSRACGNRLHAAAYRARQREGRTEAEGPPARLSKL